MVCFDSQFWWFQSMNNWPHCFGPIAYHGEHMIEENGSSHGEGGSKREKEGRTSVLFDITPQ